MTIVTAAPVSFGMPRSLLTLELFRTGLVSRKDRTMRRSERSASPHGEEARKRRLEP